jgi:hypothetical protein
MVSVVTVERVEWQRRPPRRAAGRLGWTAFLGVFVCGPAWLIFSGEPGHTDDGAVNPLALVAPSLVLLFVLLLVPQVLALVRRPRVLADHYALEVRPGVGRTLVLPWAQLTELALVRIDEEPFLLVRCGPRSGRAADWPRFWDQGHLRSARRGNAVATGYDLAVPLDDFLGAPVDLLANLSRRVPRHVTIVNSLGG